MVLLSAFFFCIGSHPAVLRCYFWWTHSACVAEIEAELAACIASLPLTVLPLLPKFPLVCGQAPYNCKANNNQGWGDVSKSWSIYFASGGPAWIPRTAWGSMQCNAMQSMGHFQCSPKNVTVLFFLSAKLAAVFHDHLPFFMTSTDKRLGLKRTIRTFPAPIWVRAMALAICLPWPLPGPTLPAAGIWSWQLTLFLWQRRVKSSLLLWFLARASSSQLS